MYNNKKLMICLKCNTNTVTNIKSIWCDSCIELSKKPKPEKVKKEKPVQVKKEEVIDTNINNVHLYYGKNSFFAKFYKYIDDINNK